MMRYTKVYPGLSVIKFLPFGGIGPKGPAGNTPQNAGMEAAAADITDI